MRLGDLPIYVISVANFFDRHSSIRSQLKRFDLDPIFIWKYDADSLTKADRARCSSGILPDKSISTVLKHIEAQYRMLESGSEWCLVLEDDALLPADFDEQLECVVELATKIESPCLIFLGGTDNHLDSRFFDADSMCLIESPLTTAEAYLLNRRGCHARLEWIKENKIDKPADHFLKQVDSLLGIKQFRVSRPFVSQGSITGHFKTSLDSSRAKHGPLYLRVRFEWNRFRKQTVPKYLARLKMVFR